jgi:hypothetical protein
MPRYASMGGGSPLWDWLQRVPPCPKALAWCHTTDAFRLREIIKKGSFAPQRCEVFEEDLLYFFYGRPAFRRNEEAQLRLTAKAPIVVVLSPDLPSQGRRMFPFDTGAFETRYQVWVHHGMTLPNFEMECSREAAQRHVSAFFATNDHYLKLTPAAPPVPYFGDFEVESIVQLLADPSASQADDRRLAVELQVGSEVPFVSQFVVALIVPDELMMAPWFSTFVALNQDVEILTYELVSLRSAGHYQALLEERAIKIQDSRGWI